MRRFYIDKIAPGTVFLTDADQLHHLKDVLRLKAGDTITVSDGKGNDYPGVIKNVGKNGAEITLGPAKAAHRESIKLTIACALPKGSRLDDAIDDLTQLGVARIIPLRTERVIIKLDVEKSDAKVERWRKIAKSAAQQSQRSSFPAVDNITDFKDVIKASGEYDLKLIPHLSGDRRLLRDIIADSKPKNILVLIGPEGDFTPDEVELALANGFRAVSLGETVLRVATAAVAVMSYIHLALGE